MPKLILRGAYIRFVDLRYDEKSKTTYTKLNFTSSFTEPVREAMQWGEPPAGFSSAKLDGEMVATHLILTPNMKTADGNELRIDCKKIGNFEVHRVKSESGDSTTNELRFQIVTSVAGAAALVGAYIEVIGKGEGALRVNYEQQAEMDLGEAEEEESDDEAVDRLISEEQAHDTSEATDEQPAGPTLGTAVLLGGTHQKETRKRQGARGTVN